MNHLNTEEFKELFDSQYPRLYRLLSGILGDCSAAEDIAQDTFLKLLQNPPAQTSNLSGWLMRVGKNLAFNRLKRENNREKRESQLGSPGREEPENALLRKEDMLLTSKALAAISARDRTCLVLRSLGHTYAEIAEIIGVETGSVGTILARARKHFRQEFLKLKGSDDSVL